MLKVLHVIPNLVKGGAQRLVVDICNELTIRPDVIVKLVYFEGENEFRHLTEQIDTYKLNIQFDLSIRTKNTIDIDAYERFVDEFQPDVIHSHLYAAELVVHENPREGKIYFTHFHDNIPVFKKSNKYLSSKKAITDWFERKRLLRKYSRCDIRFIAISNDTKQFIAKNLPSKFQTKVHLLHNAISLKSFTNDKKNADRNKQLTLINVGNFLPKKNQTFLLHLLKSLHQKIPDARLILVGDGIDRKRIEQEVDLLQLNEFVEITGHVDDVKEFYSKADIYVHSAHYEPFGLVLLEAMAMGLPVISLNGGGNADIIKNEENGFLIEQEDKELFIGRILQLVHNTELYHAITENASTFVRENFSIEKYVDELITIYLED